MKKARRNRPRKCQDFYCQTDTKDLDQDEKPPQLNLSINDFDKNGYIVDPRAPCVSTTIDPAYIQDMGSKKTVKKFRMKTDILILRDITRKKFMMYSTQQRYLDKQREYEHQERVYKRINASNKTAEQAVKEMESKSFKQMIEMQEKLKVLQKATIAQELKEVVAEHQHVVMEVQRVFERFRYLLKLIGYFDDIALEVDDELGTVCHEQQLLKKPTECFELNLSDYETVGKAQTELLSKYITEVVRPYLDKKKHLEAEVWIKGFEKIRQKITNYNRRFAQTAMLNHIVAVIYEKFQKTMSNCRAQPILKDPSVLQKRLEVLKQRAHQTIDIYTEHQKKDKISMELKAVVPIILKDIEGALAKRNGMLAVEEKPLEKTKEDKKKKQWTQLKPIEKPSSGASYMDKAEETTLSQVEKIQELVLKLLNEFDTLPPEKRKTVERQVRRRMKLDKERSQRALVQQTRLKNWMEHFKKHEMQNRNNYG